MNENNGTVYVTHQELADAIGEIEELLQQHHESVMEAIRKLREQL